MPRSRPIYWPPSEQLSQASVENYEEHAGTFWEIFYRGHQTKFFKNRHYLHREFPELAQGPLTVLEVGCGVGNTVFPLLEVNPEAFVYACDFSPTAVELIKRHEQYASGRVSAFVADITADRLADNVPESSVDICTMVFVLSAIAPEKMLQAVKNVKQVLKPGSGTILIRDYACGDLAETRFTNSSRQQRLGPQFYVRGDGTRAYYFSEAKLVALFVAAGFSCRKVRTHERSIQNRALALSMDRRWVQAVFTLADDGAQLISPNSEWHSTAVIDQPAASDIAVSSCEPEEKPSDRLSGAGNISQHGGLDSGTDRSAREYESRSETVASAAASTSCQAVEWENDEQLHALDDGLSRLFLAGTEADAEQVEEDVQIPGAGTFRVRSISREHRHTLAHTGLMLWDAAPAFAGLLAASSHLLNGKTVLELGCGSSPLCMMATLRHARRVVSTDGSAKALLSMAENISLNASRVIVERARLRQLTWGNHVQIRALAEEHPDGFDLIIGADVAYVDSFVPDLFATAASFLSPHPKARVLLCHLTRRVSEGQIIAAAESAGFYQVADTAEEIPAAQVLAEGPIRLLCFARRP